MGSIRNSQVVQSCLLIIISPVYSQTRLGSVCQGRVPIRSDGLLNVDINLMHVFIKLEVALQGSSPPLAFSDTTAQIW